MSTWAEYVAGVKSAYWTAGEPSDDQKYRALADYALSLIIKQVERDLEAAKSFKNSYDVLKIVLAGSRVTGADNVVIAAVEALMPIERDTENITALRENAILQARDDFNGTADNFDTLVLNSAMDLQRHVPFYQSRHETSYYSDTVGIVNKGFISEVTLPDGCRIQNVWAGRYHTPLVAGTYAADDIVESNGRFYKVTIGGTITTPEIGGGLTEEKAGVEETLGNLTFLYYCDSKLVPVRNLSWENREAIYSGRVGGGTLWSTSPQTEVLWLYPSLNATTTFFMLEWSGVKTDFVDADETTFDILAYQAGAQYVRAFVTKDISGDGRMSAAALATYQAAVRKALIDNQARQTGTAGGTSEMLRMNLGALPWWRQAFLNCTTSSVYQSVMIGNSGQTLANSTGNLAITPTSANHLAYVNFSGVASTRIVILSSTWENPQNGTSAVPTGARIVISASFPDAVANIVIEIRSGTTTGTLLLPLPNYVNQQFTTDGFSLSAAWEFEFNGAAWQWVRGQVPA